ncbi:MAG: esterase [Glaciecola sp.]
MKHLKPIWILVAFFLSTSAIAQGTQEQLSLNHPKFEEPLSFDINLPAGYHSETDKSYIVLFDFHHYAHTYLSGMHDWMSHNGEWPWLKTIIVTPSDGNPVGKLFDVTGKSTPMLNFFESNLFPAIDAKYRTKSFRIISGFRRNGGIALSSLLNKPDLFNAYFVISPELENDYAGIMSNAKKKLANLDKKPRFLLITTGESVKEDHQLDLYSELLEIIKEHAPKSLDVNERKLEQHYHMSMPPIATAMGIELLFDDIHNGLAPDSEIAEEGFDAIVKHYEWLSKDKYGFQVSPFFSLRNRGNYLLESEPQQAISLFEKMKNLYPDDAYAIYYLANAHSTNGDFAKAITLQKEAVQMSENMLTWHQKRHKKYLQSFQEQANLN